MSARKPSRRQLTIEAFDAISQQSAGIASVASAIGTIGQADLIASLPPLEAAHAAVKSFMVRLGSDDPRLALAFLG